MTDFEEKAFFTLVWWAILAALAVVIVVLSLRLSLVAALLAAANISLVFSLVLVIRAIRLTTERLTRSRAWRLLPPAKRPIGGGRYACDRLKEQLLRFAKGSSAIAILSSASAMLVVD